MKQTAKINVQCSACGAVFEVVAAAAGQQGYCPNCNSLVTIPFPQHVVRKASALKDSCKTVVGSAISWACGVAFLVGFGIWADSLFVLWSGCLLAGIGLITWFIMMLAYVRTIAVNSERQ